MHYGVLMNDIRVIIAIVIAVAVVIVIWLLRERITGFVLRISKKGLEGNIKADTGAAPPAQGVDLTGAKFKDENEFIANSEAKVKAPNLQAGNRNKFLFGSGSGPSSKKKSKN